MLSVLLLYPALFSFLHVLTHHLDSHHHVNNNEHCCEVSYPAPGGEENISFAVSAEHCPIADFEFPAAIKNLNIINGGIDLYRTILFFRIENRLSYPDICGDNAPRAPPVCIS